MADLQNFINSLNWENREKFIKSFNGEFGRVFKYSSAELDNLRDRVVREIWKEFSKNPKVAKLTLFKDSRPWWKKFIHAVLKIDKGIGKRVDEFFKSTLVSKKIHKSLKQEKRKRQSITKNYEKLQSDSINEFLLKRRQILANFLKTSASKLISLVAEKEELQKRKKSFDNSYLGRLKYTKVTDKDTIKKQEEIDNFKKQIESARKFLGMETQDIEHSARSKIEGKREREREHILQAFESGKEIISKQLEDKKKAAEFLAIAHTELNELNSNLSKLQGDKARFDGSIMGRLAYPKVTENDILVKKEEIHTLETKIKDARQILKIDLKEIEETAGREGIALAEQTALKIIIERFKVELEERKSREALEKTFALTQELNGEKKSRGTIEGEQQTTLDLIEKLMKDDKLKVAQGINYDNKNRRQKIQEELRELRTSYQEGQKRYLSTLRGYATEEQVQQKKGELDVDKQRSEWAKKVFSSQRIKSSPKKHSR